jgi:hypothetical protein
MKSYWKTLIVPCLVFALFTLLPQICNAQLGDPAGDPDAPIDGGVGVLIAAGVGYGVKKYREANRKKQNPDSGV